MRELTISKEDAGRRADRFLRKYLDTAPAGFIYKAFRKNCVKLCGRHAKGDEVLKEGDILKLYFTDEQFSSFKSAGAGSEAMHRTENSQSIGGGRLTSKNRAESSKDSDRASACKPVITDGLKQKDKERKYKQLVHSDDTYDSFVKLRHDYNDYFDLVYEDADVIVANKYAGVLSQKAAPDDYTLNEALLVRCGYYRNAVTAFVPSVCNRLDRNTSGLILFAKSYGAARELSAILKDRSVHKYYIAVVYGNVTEYVRLEAWIRKDRKTNQSVILDAPAEGAEHIETAFGPAETADLEALGIHSAHGSLCGADYTVLKVELITGRSHQIRAHLAAVSHPIVADPKYGHARLDFAVKKNYGINFQLLHAWKLRFPEGMNAPLKHLSGKTLYAALPERFKCVK